MSNETEQLRQAVQDAPIRAARDFLRVYRQLPWLTALKDHVQRPKYLTDEQCDFLLGKSVIPGQSHLYGEGWQDGELLGFDKFLLLQVGAKEAVNIRPLSAGGVRTELRNGRDTYKQAWHDDPKYLGALTFNS